MRYDLYRFPEVFSPTLSLQNFLVDLSAGEVVEATELSVGESFVMPEVQIGFRAIIQNIDLPMLEGTHRSWIDIQIRIKFLKGNLQAPAFEQGAQRRGGETFPQRTDHATCDKNIFGFLHLVVFPIPSSLRTFSKSSGVSTPMLSYATIET